MSLIGLIYLSQQSQDFSEQEIQTLIDDAENANQSNDISGFISCKDKNFIQYIEGDEEKTSALFKKITQDPRHNVLISRKISIESRKFESWNMNFISCQVLAELSVESYLFSQLNELALAPELISRVENIVWQGVDVIAKQHQQIISKSIV